MSELSNRNTRYAPGMAIDNIYTGQLNLLLQEMGRHAADSSVKSRLF